ncbi:hypothetical protein [Chitinimonas sp.]|uniref:hypothetical protein n=1 Tax=Chitinimonas sp. TaxID=1934313 RepID=UPI0035B09285
MKMDFQVALLSALSTIAGIIVTLIFNIIQRKQQFAQDGERDAQRRKHELYLKNIDFHGFM